MKGGEVAKKVVINWEVENEKVREACFAILKAQDIHDTMTEEEKERFDHLVSIMTEPEPEEKGTSIECNHATLPIQEA